MDSSESEESEPEREFVVERHGNSKKPHTSSYFRKDNSLKNDIKESLKSGKFADEVYIEISTERESATTVSKLIHNPKMIHNFKQREKTNKKVMMSKRSQKN